MVWNKTSLLVENKIIEALYDYNKTYTDIAKELQISKDVVYRIAHTKLTKEVLKERYSFFCTKTKLGNKNHMFGRMGLTHHNAKDKKIRVAGYKTVFAPSWFKGGTVKSGRVYEHILVWCEYFEQDQLPEGFVIHHLDLNKDNNDITNLVLLSISHHIKLHWEIRKVQRLSRKGVGNSVPEAQSIQ